MNIDKIFEHGKDFAKIAFKIQGEVLPMWIMETEDGDLKPVTVPLFVMKDKDAVVEAIRKLLSDLRAVQYVSLLEAWMVEAKDKKEGDEVLGNLDKVPVREHPNKIEIIQVMAQDRQQSRSGYFRIIRPKDGKPHLSEFKDTSDSQSVGRFMDLLNEKPTIQ